MAFPFLANNTTVLAKVETTYGVDSVPLAANAIFSELPSIALQVEALQRNFVKSNLSPIQAIIGRKSINLGLRTELKSELVAADGNVLVPMKIHPLLVASGLQATYTVETAPGANDGFVTYTPRSTNFESATLYVFPGGEVRHKMLGSFGNLSAEFIAGQFATMNVDLQGNYVEPTDTAAPSVTLPTDTPVQIASIGLTFGAIPSTDIVCRNFNFNLGNNISLRPDVNSPEGLKGFRISSRAPTASFRIEKQSVATWNIYNAISTNVAYAVTATIGTVAGQRITVAMPKFSITNIQEVEDSGFAAWQIEGTLAGLVGDDELSLKFF